MPPHGGGRVDQGDAGYIRTLATALTLLALTLASQPVSAHLLNMSKSRVSLLPGGEVEVQLALDLLLTVGSRDAYYALSLIDDPLAQAPVISLLEPLPEAIHLSIGGVRVPLRITRIQFPKDSEETFLDPFRWPRTHIVLRGNLASLAQQPATDELRIYYGEEFRFEEPIANTFEDTATGLSQTRWLVTGQRSPVFDAGGWAGAMALSPSSTPTDSPADHRSDWEGVRAFIVAGLHHILPEGYDHLLFVAALCLGARSVRGLVVIITLFTLAHSLTLTAMALGWVVAPSRWVEPLILLSILWVAAANLRAQPAAHGRASLVVAFGLVHGLGFAGALRELGLPSEQLLPSLVAFNVGVELGQLVFIALLLVFLAFTGFFSASKSPLLPVVPTWRRSASLFIAAAAAGLLVMRFAGLH